MIVRMSGTVADVEPHAVILERDGVGHEVMIPGYAVGELSAHRGREVTLHTLEYLEGGAGGSNLVPRLIGFMHKPDRAFFNRFVEVKGIGPRKALKALSEPVGRIAAWIREGDTRSLAQLPGIGKRAAEMIVAELRGKVDEFVTGHTTAGAAPRSSSWNQVQRDAIEIMVAWGDARGDVERWMERAAQLHPDTRAADEWVRLCYRIRSGSEG